MYGDNIMIHPGKANDEKHGMMANTCNNIELRPIHQRMRLKRRRQLANAYFSTNKKELPFR